MYKHQSHGLNFNLTLSNTLGRVGEVSIKGGFGWTINRHHSYSEYFDRETAWKV